MRKNIVFFFFIVTFLSGCTMTREVEYGTGSEGNYSYLNYLASVNSSTVHFKNGSKAECVFLEVRNDSIFFIQKEISEKQGFHIDNVTSVKLDAYQASIASCLLGGVGALVLGSVIAESYGYSSGGHPDLGPLIIGIAASPLGMIPAYIWGGKYEFVFKKNNAER